MNDKFDLVIANFVDHIRFLGEGGHHQLEEREDYLVFKTGLPHPMCNWIIGSGTPEDPKDLFPDDLPFLWLSDKWSETLDTKLQKLGLSSEPMSGMIGAFDDLDDIETDPRISITEDLDLWFHIASRVWETPIEMLRVFLRALEAKHDHEVLFVAKIDGEAVGCAALHFDGKTAGFHWNSVLPEYRGQGIGSGLARERIRCAKERGYKVGTAACRDSSIGIFQRLGFEKASEMGICIPQKYIHSLNEI